MSKRRPKRQPRYRNRRQSGIGARRRMAIVFALGLGCFGVHRFTLGQWQMGLLHIFLMVVSLSVFEGSFLGSTPWVTLSAFLAYGTAAWWWRMSDEEFADRYLEPTEEVDENVTGEYLNGRTAAHPKVKSRRERRKMLARANTQFEAYELQEAADLYEAALDLDLSDGNARVLAARCYSLLEQESHAYRHLRKAVQLEADNLTLVSTDPSFAWLRTRPDFVARQRRGFTPPDENRNGAKTANGHAEPYLQELPSPGVNILDQLDRLGELRERGVLTEEEFVRQKRKLLQ